VYRNVPEPIRRSAALPPAAPMALGAPPDARCGTARVPLSMRVTPL